MTRQTFYRKLRRYANKFTWKITAQNHIRATCEGVQGNFCPITAVYYAEKNVKMMNADYNVAAEKMDMDWMDAGQIAYSADNLRMNDPTYRNNMIIRKTLLRSVGLK